MPKLNRKTERYAHGTIRPSRDGARFCASIYLAGGERRRAQFRDVASARLWLDTQSAEYRPLSSAQMLDASRAYAMLPEDVTLLDCAKFYVSSKTAAKDISFEDAADRFTAAKRQSLRDVTVRWYENALAMLGSMLGEVPSLCELDRPRIEREIERLKPSMRNAMLRVLSAFFSWAVKSGYAVANPVAGIEKVRLSKPKRAVLGVPEARAMLAMCEYALPSAVPYLAVGLFAGIRPHEMRKLRAEDFRNGYIYLGPDVAKTSSERTVPIRPNLAEWLAAYPPPDGVYSGSDTTLTRTLRKLFYAVGADERKDILRHSYASYAYELTGDAAKVAAELGHTDTSMLFRHYRGLVPPKSGEAFFSLTPKTVAQTLPKRRTQTAPKRT